MLYFFFKQATPYKRTQVETWDGKIVAASPALAWAIGKDISSLIYRCEYSGYRWQLTDRRLPCLQKCPALISDAELYDKVSP